MHHQLHLVANAAVTGGGEAVAALRYAESIARAGCMVTLLSKHIGGQDRETLVNGDLELQIAPTRRNMLSEVFAQYGYMQKLCDQKRTDLIHIHGMWTPILAVGALVARKRGLPLIISPHGCLDPWGLQRKHHKKWLALKTYQGASLCGGSLFVATAGQEENSIRKFGLRQPVAVIPIGVDVGPVPRRDARSRIKTILFLSRIHPVKGLLDLVEAWVIVRRPGWRILVAGGDEDGYRAKVEDRIRAMGLESDFEFLGFVDGARKQACFDRADVFVLPTYSENFGIAIAEALANELPVITTTGAPWRDLIDYRCGWWVDPGVQGVSNALRAAIECDPGELRQMGQRGRQLMLGKYSWAKIGFTALEVSEWLLDRSRPKPEVVKEYE